MFNKLKQIKDLKDKAKKLKSKLSEVEVTGKGLGGQISITMNGAQEILNVSIEDAVLKPENKSKVEDGVKAAFKDAHKQVQKKLMSQVGSLDDLQLPDLG